MTPPQIGSAILLTLALWLLILSVGRSRNRRTLWGAVAALLLAAGLLLLVGCATIRPVQASVIDQDRRVIWAADEEQARDLCWTRYHVRARACAGADDVLILPRDADTKLIDHEWCHRYGWGPDHPRVKPEACAERPWWRDGSIRRP